MHTAVWFICIASFSWGIAVAQPTPAHVAVRAQPSAPVQPPLPGAAVGFFKELLAMPPADRERAIVDRGLGERRKVLLTKIQEYEEMPGDQRQHKLQLLEFWGTLVPLMQMRPEDRGPTLARIPEPDRKRIEERLREWDLLPPELQQEQSRKAFVRFFEMPPHQKEKTLEALPGEERMQMEKVLQRFSELSPDHQRMCIDSFSKLAKMSNEERAQFLKNAERWSAMTPRERETWRNFINLLPRTTPPMPDGSGTSRPPPAGSNQKGPDLPGYGKN